MGDNSSEQEQEPVWGTPPPDDDQPSRPADASQTAGARLLAADTIAVIEQGGFLTSRSYELVAANGALLGSLSEQAGAGGWIFGSAASSTFTLVDPAGQVVAIMNRPGTAGRFQFSVADADETEVGMVEQENSFFTPQFHLRSLDGPQMRLVGGSVGSTSWELVDAQDESVLLGSVSQEFAGLSGLLGGTQRFAVRLSPVLTGGPRLLALMVAVCLDYVRDAKRRR